LKAGILHHALKHAAGDDGHLEGQVLAKIECEGLGLVFHVPQSFSRRAVRL
jgi:hypothetical protein